MQVKEIMNKQVKSISLGMNAKEALDLLERLQISGLPVIDENKHLVGMFTEKEILTNILPSYLNNIGVVAYDVAKKTIKERINALLLLTVKDIMRTEVIFVRQDTSIFEIARIMIKDKTRRIPVVNNNNEVVGIIARVDIMKFLFL